MKLYTIRLDPVRNKVCLIGLVATVGWILETEDGDLVALENGKGKISCMEDILCVSMEVNYRIFILATGLVRYLQVWHFLFILKLIR
jgi:hypothetical protein